jgi:hypothetical protein
MPVSLAQSVSFPCPVSQFQSHTVTWGRGTVKEGTTHHIICRQALWRVGWTIKTQIKQLIRIKANSGRQREREKVRSVQGYANGSPQRYF